MKHHTTGGFTLPGEAGCEALTLDLARRWGADVIRDSDGTELSDEILQAGYDIYSTICIIREHNDWARQHPDCLQQTFLSTQPALAEEESLSVPLMAGFFDQQFKVNDRPAALALWQVWDRTEETLLPADACVINVGRGTALDQKALAEALNSGKLAGAALDVMDPEPLPQDDPLWDARNIILTPHVSGNMTLGYTCDENVARFCADLENYAAGRPLAGLVDRNRGY